MAGNIKGIIVEIGGDTSGLQKALSKVNSATSSLSKELRGINSLLKLDPKNTELLNQKQEVLANTIAETENKLKLLKSTYQRGVESEVNGAKISEENWRNLQREIIATEQKLGQLKLETSNWTKAGKSIEEIGQKIENLGSKMSNLGNKLTTRLTLPIAALVSGGIAYNAELEKYTTAFTTFLGDATEAEKVINKIKEDAARTPFDTASLVQANQLLVSTGVNADDSREAILALGNAVIATGGGNEELTRMAVNLQQIRNAGKATSLDIKQFAYAGIDVYGILADYTGKTTAEVKELEVSYEDMIAALIKAGSQGGKYFGAMEKSSQTLTGQTTQLVAEFKELIGSLTKSLMPIIKKIVAQVRDWIKAFDKLSDGEKENIVRIGLLVAAAGPLVKILGTVTTVTGGVVKGVGTFTKAIGVMKTGVASSSASVNTLAKLMSGLASPMGIAAVGITVAVGVIIAQIKKAEQETKDSLSNMGKGASDFIEGINNATSYLDGFNSTLFASNEEQQRLQDNMEEVQRGITQICKIASEERRELTQGEIQQLEEYFATLRDLKNRELQIEQSIATAITQQAQQASETFSGSLEEYKVLSQNWIKTAEEQKDKEIKIINQRTTEEIALLAQRYGARATLEDEEYAREYNLIEQNKNLAIQAAESQVAAINQTYANGYLERTKQNDSFYNEIRAYNERVEEETNRHNYALDSIENNALLNSGNKLQARRNEMDRHQQTLKQYWSYLWNDMNEAQEKELGTWLALVSQTEMYGGEISEETKKIVDDIINSLDSMPNETKDVMKNAMEPMLTVMKNKEPALYAQASSIANGILGRLRKSFDIHSPSRETRKIFDYVMQGAEKGLEDEEQSLYRQVDNISNNVLKRMNPTSLSGDIGNINSMVIDKAKTVFTTPQIVFNVQELDEGKLQQCFNYVNRKFGSAY